MQLHNNLKDKKGYLERMAQPLQEKVRIANYIPPDVRDVLDVGCADGAVTTALAEVLPRARVLGIDLDQEFIAAATALPATESSRLQFKNVYLRDLLKDERRFDVVLFTSVLHEFFSYGEGISSVLKALADAHELVRSGGEIVIRDMVPLEYSKRTISQASSLVEKMKARSDMGERIADFERAHGELATLHSVNHFLLKYFYTDNWLHECAEHYMPITLEQYEQIFELMGMELVHRETYTLPYLAEKWKEDFGFSDIEISDLISTSILVARKV